MPRFVVCVPAQGAPSAAPCSDVDGVAHQPVSMLLPAPGEVHWENADQLFAAGFVGVLTIWLAAWAMGQIIGLIRRD